MNNYDPNRLDRIDTTLEKIAESQKEIAESQKRFDERIARLTDRHEALSQSVEISKHDMDDLIRQTNLKFAQTAELINRLAQIVQTHERRLDNLESGRL